MDESRSSSALKAAFDRLKPQPATGDVVATADLPEDARAVLCELDEQEEKITLLLRASEIRLDETGALLEDAVQEWLAFGAVRGALFAHVGDQCLKYSGRTKGELRKKIIRDKRSRKPTTSPTLPVPTPSKQPT